LFTGLIEEVGRVERMVESDGKRRLTLASSELVRELKTGNSIAVSFRASASAPWSTWNCPCAPTIAWAATSSRDMWTAPGSWYR
jgi:hypothetical protein